MYWQKINKTKNKWDHNKGWLWFSKTIIELHKLCEIWRIERESHDCSKLTRLKKLGQAETENRNNAHTASNSSRLLSCNNLKK